MSGENDSSGRSAESIPPILAPTLKVISQLESEGINPELCDQRLNCSDVTVIQKVLRWTAYNLIILQRGAMRASRGGCST
jgi:hypothetical protein